MQPDEFPASVGEAWLYWLIVTASPWLVFAAPLAMEWALHVDVPTGGLLPVVAVVSGGSALLAWFSEVLPAYDRRGGSS